MGDGSAGGVESDASYVSDVDAWHASRVERLQDPEGWLTLSGLHPLRAGSYTVAYGGGDIDLGASGEGAVGTLTVDGSGVGFRAAAGADVRIDGAPVKTAVLVSDGAGEATVLRHGSVLMHVIEREGLLYLRVRDRESPLLAGFAGVPRFPVDDTYRVTARLVAGTGGMIEVPSALGGTSVSESPGVLEFELKGERFELTPTANADGSLFIVFGDATNGRTTYGAGRFLSADAPGVDGAVELDFNRAYNMVCAFSPFATCPFPPAGNRLSIEVNAGEKTPISSGY